MINPLDFVSVTHSDRFERYETALLSYFSAPLDIWNGDDKLELHSVIELETGEIQICSKDGILLVGMTVGAPVAAIVLACLYAIGVSTAVGIGSCGALSTHPPAGTIVVPEAAIIDEGTSRFYNDPSLGDTISEPRYLSYPSPWVAAHLIAHYGLKPVQPRVWSTDALFRETPDAIRAARLQGASIVDMETSALFSVAMSLGMNYAQVLVVGDGFEKNEAGESEWVYRDLGVESADRTVLVAELIRALTLLP